MVEPRNSRHSERNEPLRGRVEARIFTPPLRELTPTTSAGFAAIRFAEEILDVHLLDWQKWVLVRALELTEDGGYRFRTVVLLVARQNGKSTLLLVLALWRMFVEASPLVIGTAQNLDVAEELWTQATGLAESIPELAELVEHVDRTNGKKALRLVTGERYKVAAASRRGGRGLSGDLVLLDELREHQTWEAWAAVTKTTMARAFAQVWAASNAGDASSIVLRHLRSLAHEALGYPDGRDGLNRPKTAVDGDEQIEDDSLALFEYSAAPGRGIWDRDGWAEANPALGHLIAESSIASAVRTDPDGVVRTEVLCQFVSTASTGPFPVGAWQTCTVEKVLRDPERPLAYALDVSYDRTLAHVAVAFWDSEGRRRVEVAASRAGTDWLVPWLTSPDRAVPVSRVAVQATGAPASSLLPELEAAGIGVAKWGGGDLARACGMFHDAVASGTVSHGPQPLLDVAAATAHVKPLGDGWAIDRRSSPEDASPLMAAIGANWLLLTPERSVVSAYEDGDFVLV